MKSILYSAAIAILSVSMLLAVAGDATAQEPSPEQIEQFKTMLDKQADLDTKGVSEKDREMARKWLKEAEVLLANGDEEAAKYRLRRVEYALDLIRAMVAASVIRQQAEEQEATAHKAPQIAAELEKEVEELREEKQSLQRELKKLQQ